MSRATSRAFSWIERGTLRAGIFGQQRGLSSQASQIMLAGAVEQCCSIIHQGPRGSQHLASWADVNVALLIVCEVVPRERSIGAGRLVEHRNVRLNCPLVD